MMRHRRFSGGVAPNRAPLNLPLAIKLYDVSVFLETLFNKTTGCILIVCAVYRARQAFRNETKVSFALLIFPGDILNLTGDQC